jgi:hypothetical protein
MNDPKEPVRNRPVEEGRNNDPDLRDESALQPGISTVSSSDTDDANDELTKTASDDFRTGEDSGENADPGFDEINEGA